MPGDSRLFNLDRVLAAPKPRLGKMGRRNVEVQRLLYSRETPLPGLELLLPLGAGLLDGRDAFQQLERVEEGTGLKRRGERPHVPVVALDGDCGHHATAFAGARPLA